jgi:DNA transformation protein and related proteins
MRNSKVRARIAAGKLRLRIRDLRNLGQRTECLLEHIGVHSVEELRRRGAVRAYAELRRAGVTGTLNLLWALAGALEPWPEGRHWREVARGDERLSLLLALEDLQSALGNAPVHGAGPDADSAGARPGGRRRRRSH